MYIRFSRAMAACLLFRSSSCTELTYSDYIRPLGKNHAVLGNLIRISLPCAYCLLMVPSNGLLICKMPQSLQVTYLCLGRAVGLPLSEALRSAICDE